MQVHLTVSSDNATIIEMQAMIAFAGVSRIVFEIAVEVVGRRGGEGHFTTNLQEMLCAHHGATASAAQLKI
jgi:hypothetical protein